MLKMMARENMEEWETSAAIVLETVRATVEAYGAGIIELASIPAITRPDVIRYAPGFLLGEPHRVGQPDGR